MIAWFSAIMRQAVVWPGTAAMQNLHPLIVHFPIALLITATLVYCAAWLARREAWAWVALWMLALGTLAAIAAVWTGLQASDSVMIAPSVRDHILYYHKRCMLAVLAGSLVLTGWAMVARPWPRRGRMGFIVLLIALSALLAKGADYGGWMVYGYNAGGSLPQPIEFGQ